MISTRELSGLPDVDGLKRVWQSMAMLDAILCPEWEYRYYSFYAGWAPGEQMGSMRNGSGDEVFALFCDAGCWMKGFAHEAPMARSGGEGARRVWPGVLDAVPSEFAECLSEPAFKVEDTTFCVWRGTQDLAWRMGPIEFPPDHVDPDGSGELLSAFDGDPERFRAWAEGYYERSVSAIGVRAIYEHRPLSNALVAVLNDEVSLAELEDDVEEIGYPASSDAD